MAELIIATTAMIAMHLATSDGVSNALRPYAQRLISQPPTAAAAAVATPIDTASGSDAIVMP